MLKIKEIFQSIQGEGPHTGRPAVFIRLSGCNLTCSFCDTDHANGSTLQTHQILQQVEKLSESGLVVITGGEPFLQDIRELVITLRTNRYEVQIESNGSINPFKFDQWDEVMLVISPKSALLRPDLINNASAIKFVVKHSEALPDGTCQWAHDRGLLVYVTPCDEKDPAKNKANLDWAIQEVNRVPGSRLGLQIHKLIDVR